MITKPEDIREEDLVFSPLGHAPFIANARVRISDHFALSISYNYTPGSWYVGEKGSYEVGVLVFDKDDNEPGTDLTDMHVDGHTSNIWSRCDINKIRELATLALKLEYVGAIHCYGKWGTTADYTWHNRFFAAAGRDLRRKAKYAAQTFGEYNVRLVVSEDTPPIFTLGRRELYDAYIAKDQYAGKAELGSVWQTKQEAERARALNPEYSVYQVLAPWGLATRPDENAENPSRQHELLVPVILRQCPTESSSEKSD